MTESKLINGSIPAKQECPYKADCAIAQDDMCRHQGIKHDVPYSCASARAFDLGYVYRKQPANCADE